MKPLDMISPTHRLANKARLPPSSPSPLAPFREEHGKKTGGRINPSRNMQQSQKQDSTSNKKTNKENNETTASPGENALKKPPPFPIFALLYFRKASKKK